MIAQKGHLFQLLYTSLVVSVITVYVVIHQVYQDTREHLNLASLKREIGEVVENCYQFLQGNCKTFIQCEICGSN